MQVSEITKLSVPIWQNSSAESINFLKNSVPHATPLIQDKHRVGWKIYNLLQFLGKLIHLIIINQLFRTTTSG